MFAPLTTHVSTFSINQIDDLWLNFPNHYSTEPLSKQLITSNTLSRRFQNSAVYKVQRTYRKLMFKDTEKAGK